jgi:AcrR family transcriptional regulator
MSTPLRGRRLDPDARREEIVAGALRLFTEHPYAAVSTTDLAGEAGVVRRLTTIPEVAVSELPPGTVDVRAGAAVDWFLDAVERHRGLWLSVGTGAAGDIDVDAILAEADEIAADRVLAADGLSTIDLPDPGEDPGARLDRAVEVMWWTYQQAYFWASVELWTAARTDPALAEALLPAERRLGAAIRQTVDVFFEDYADPARAALVRETLLTAMRGVALTYGFDPRDPQTDPHLEQWKQLARMLLLPEGG